MLPRFLKIEYRSTKSGEVERISLPVTVCSSAEVGESGQTVNLLVLGPEWVRIPHAAPFYSIINRGKSK